MPWREIIFTDAGPVYPATWDMHKPIREMVESTVHKKLSVASSVLGKHNLEFPFVADFADDGDSTSEASM